MSDLISRQAALYAIYGICNEPVAWLIRAAREIEKLPSAQPEERTEERTETHACDCISRQAAIDTVGNMLRRKFGIGGDLAEITLAGLPPAQPEIIRCKDCRFNTYSKKCLNPDSFFLVPADDFYCGYAERKENR